MCAWNARQSCAVSVAMRRGWISARGATIALGVMALCAGCDRVDGEGAAARPPAQPARTESARSQPATHEALQALRVPGRIALADNRTWRVGIRTDGVVVAVLAGVGDYVRQGQVLARYHADEVRDSRAKYHVAQSDLDRAQSNAALAQRNLERVETLIGLKAASQQQLEQARQDLVTAQAAAREAQSEVGRLRDLLEDDLKVPAEPKPGDETSDQVPIVAPASGYILEKNLTLGRAIDTEDDTFVIGDLSQVWMLASVQQDQLEALRMGQHVRVTVEGTSHVFDGTITNLGQSLDPQTRTMQVRVALSNPNTELRPGMLATAEIVAD
jgi:membrane fusion protein, heavy metal efflux system